MHVPGLHQFADIQRFSRLNRLNGPRVASKQTQAVPTQPGQFIKKGYPVSRQHPLLDTDFSGKEDFFSIHPD
jgi:hypothetical protein